MKIYFAPGCPYAHRSRALLTHLGAAFENREIDLAAKPADFLAISPTGKVPLIDDDGFVLYESAVINEYLAERFSFAGFSRDVHERALERLAIVQFDQAVVPVFFQTLKAPETELPPNLGRELERIANVVRGKPVESLLGFHLATFWLRWNWVAPELPFMRKIREIPGLSEWLDRAVALPSVQATAPDRETTARSMLAKFGPKKA